jgi:hypothetical protein
VVKWSKSLGLRSTIMLMQLEEVKKSNCGVRAVKEPAVGELLEDMVPVVEAITG